MKSIIWKGFSWVMENMAVVGMAIFVVMFLTESIKNTVLEHDNKSLNNQLSVSQLLNKVTQSAITLHYQVSLDNIKAKQLEDSEHVKVKTVIKTVLKDNECANTDFSDDLTNELRKYERDLRARAASTDTGPLNR
ncbi:hypothetical protein [Providencia heimbachae]|uniref:hypothetical protein n=1 Tax=Providencia heimbachae TaxID=333962 RepID=UPI001E56E54A